MDEGAFAMEPLRDGLVYQRPLRHCRLPSPLRLSLRSPLSGAGDMTSQLLLVFVFFSAAETLTVSSSFEFGSWSDTT